MNMLANFLGNPALQAGPAGLTPEQLALAQQELHKPQVTQHPVPHVRNATPNHSP